MAYDEVAKKATYKYRGKFEELRFSVPKGKKQEIVDHAAAMGESINVFVNRAVKETMERDKKTNSLQTD